MARKAASKAAGPVKIDASVRVAVIFGVEEMLKRQYLDELRTVMREAHGDFDCIYFDGASATLADVLDEVRTFSLLQPFKMVVVDDADDFVKREGHREALQRYAENPVEQAALLLRAPLWNKGNLDKAIEKAGFIARCDPLAPGEVPAWLATRARMVHGVTLKPEVMTLLIDRLGTNLMRLDSELAKLSVAAPPGGEIGVDLVKAMVGRGSEEKAWVIQEAVLQALQGNGSAAAGQGTLYPGRDLLGTLHELVDLAGNDEVPVQFAVTDLMRKICFAAIMRAKGGSEFKIVQQLGLWGPAKDAVLNISRKIEPARARKWFDKVMEMNLRQRQGAGDAMRNLESFLALIACG